MNRRLMGLLGMLRGRSMDRELDEELAESDEHDLFGSPVQSRRRSGSRCSAALSKMNEWLPHRLRFGNCAEYPVRLSER